LGVILLSQRLKIVEIISISNFKFQDGEYSSTVKNQQSVKELNMKYMYMKNRKNVTVHVFYDQNWSVFNSVKLVLLGVGNLFFVSISGIKELNMKYMYMKNRKN
jgi:hypothetical protein